MEKINIALAKLERIKEFLKGWQQKKAVSNIERNIVLNQLAALYDELFDLGMPIGVAENKVVEVTSSKIEKPKREELQTPATVAKIEVEVNEKEPAIVVQVPPIANNNVVENKEKEVSKEKETSSTVKQEAKDKTVRLGDKFVGIHKYLYENFEHQDDASIARFSAIDDINRAIGINDRFLFIKELFNGDKDLFNKTISTLNSCSSLDDALMHIHENFSWSSEDSTVKQLVLLLYRRFK